MSTSSQPDVATPRDSPTGDNNAAGRFVVGLIIVLAWVFIKFNGLPFGHHYTGTFQQVENIDYTMMGIPRHTRIRYELEMHKTSLVWSKQDMDTGAMTLRCEGSFPEPDSHRSIVLQVRVNCSGDDDFFEDHDKVLTYSASADQWTVPSRHLLTDISVPLVRE